MRRPIPTAGRGARVHSRRGAPAPLAGGVDKRQGASARLRSRRSVPPRPTAGLWPRAGPARSASPAPAAAHGRPGPIRCRRARRRAHPARAYAEQPARAARAASRWSSIRHSGPLLRRQSGPRRRRVCIPGLRRRPVRARRAPASHRSRETRRPACRSASAPQGAAPSSCAGLRPQAAGAAAGPGPRRLRRHGTVQPVHRPPARCPCIFRSALSQPRPALAEACTSVKSARLHVRKCRYTAMSQSCLRVSSRRKPNGLHATARELRASAAKSAGAVARRSGAAGQ